MVWGQRKHPECDLLTLGHLKTGHFLIPKQVSYESTNTSRIPGFDHARLCRARKDVIKHERPAEWVEDLWTIYTDCMIAQGELGHNPKASDLFCTFRELVFFFQKLDD